MTTLRDELLELVSDLRDLPREFGLRRYRVYVRRRVWSGGRPGSGSVTDLDYEITPPPRVQDVSLQEVHASGGIYQQGDYKLTAITPRFVIGDWSFGGYLPEPSFDPPVATVTPMNTTAHATWSYYVVGETSLGGASDRSATASTTTGVTALNAIAFNRIAWAAVTGAERYRVYRVAVGGTPSSLGLIGTTTGTSFDDNGKTGDGTSWILPALRLSSDDTGKDWCYVLRPVDTTGEPETECILINSQWHRSFRYPIVVRRIRGQGVRG